MRILGIDPSLTGTGYIILENGKIKKSLLISTKPPKIKNEINTTKRLLEIKDKIDIDSVNAVFIEGMSFMAIGRTTSLMQLAGLNYLIREKIVKAGKQMIIVTPTQLKKFICGKGNVKKDLMLLETYKRFDKSFTNDNLCDAFCLAKIGDMMFNNSDKKTSFQEEIISQLRGQII